MAKKKPKPAEVSTPTDNYEGLLGDVVALLESARRTSVRAVNVVMTTTYWEVGRRIVEREQGGRERAVYGGELIERLSKDLSGRFGRGFSQRNLQQMRQFYLCWPIPQTLSAESTGARPPEESGGTRGASLPLTSINSRGMQSTWGTSGWTFRDSRLALTGSAHSGLRRLRRSRTH
ncbi:MAG: DUF1016 N-terminal domain-containing protein [Pirellulaceae bacterium]